MKIKLTAMICVAAMLVTLLAGCGAEPGETTIATEAQPLETTEPTLSITIPTEPKTFFEERGLTLWEGIEPNTGYYYLDYLSEEDLLDIPYKITLGTYEQFGTELAYARKADRTKTIGKYVVDTELNVVIEEFPSEYFVTSVLEDAVDIFYTAYLDSEDATLSKEEWLALYKDYNLVHIIAERYACTSDVFDEVLEKEKDGCYFVVHVKELAIMDMIAGKYYCPNYKILDTVQNFTVGTEDEECEISAFYHISAEFLGDSNTNEFGNDYIKEDIYVLLPESYDGLAFIYSDVTECGEDEDYFNSDETDSDEAGEATGAWDTFDDIADFRDIGRYKLHYFAMMEE